MSDAAQAVGKLGERLQAAMGQRPPKMPQHRHHDDDYWDRIEVDAEGVKLRAFMVPRYKTSGMSGDEWRVHAKLEVTLDGVKTPIVSHGFHRMRGLLEHAAHFIYATAAGSLGKPDATLTAFRKGVVLTKQTFPTFGDAALGMGWHIVTANEGSAKAEWRHLTNAEELARCQQVGCAEPPKNFYRLKKLQVGNGSLMVEPEYDFTGQFTWYCARHTERGDCGLEDADENMILVDGNGVPVVHPADESPSVMGGVVEVKLP